MVKIAQSNVGNGSPSHVSLSFASFVRHGCLALVFGASASGNYNTGRGEYQTRCSSWMENNGPGRKKGVRTPWIADWTDIKVNSFYLWQITPTGASKYLSPATTFSWGGLLRSFGWPMWIFRMEIDDFFFFWKVSKPVLSPPETATVGQYPRSQVHRDAKTLMVLINWKCFSGSLTEKENALRSFSSWILITVYSMRSSGETTCA